MFLTQDHFWLVLKKKMQKIFNCFQKTALKRREQTPLILYLVGEG